LARTPRDLRAGYDAYFAGRRDEARRIFAELATRLGVHFGPIDFEEWSSTESSASGRFVLVETGRCVFDHAGGNTSRHCGEVLVDATTRKILRYLPVEPYAFGKRGTFFVGDSLAVWKGHGSTSPPTRALVSPADAKEIDELPGEPIVLLPGGTRLVTASGRALDVRDISAHRNVAHVEWRGGGAAAAGVDSVIGDLPFRLLRNGTRLVAFAGEEVAGFDLEHGSRLFSLATDSYALAISTSVDEKVITVHAACDYAERLPERPVPGCTPKAACPRASMCPRPTDARVDVVTGKTTFVARAAKPVGDVAIVHAHVAPSGTNLNGRLGGLFCIADELIVPAEVCPHD